MTQTVGVRIAIVGTTASGKSALAERIATELASRGRAAEIVSADSMCVYRGMDVGTAKPTPEDQQRWPTHGIDLVNPDQEFSVAEYQRYALALLEGIEQRGAIPILVGGTGLYIDAVVNELTMPPQFPLIKQSLHDELATGVGVQELYARLAMLDPEAAMKMEVNNERRIVRALEVCLGSGRPFSSFGPGLVAAQRRTGSDQRGLGASEQSGLSAPSEPSGPSGPSEPSEQSEQSAPSEQSEQSGPSEQSRLIEQSERSRLIELSERSRLIELSEQSKQSLPWLLCGPIWPRPALRKRIAERFSQQLLDGFVNEARMILDHYGETRSKTARQALGYRELWAHLEGECPLQEAVDRAVLRTGQFAVRQERWFRRDPRITWIPGESLAKTSPETPPSAKKNRETMAGTSVEVERIVNRLL